MQRLRKILIWVDDRPGSAIALQQAATLARSSGAALTLAHAVERPGALLRALYAPVEEVHNVLLGTWRERLEALAQPLRDEGLEVSTRTLEGKPFLAFTLEVQRAGHDLLVKPADAGGGGALLGSTDMHLLRKCPCAIWITNWVEATPPGILALVDPDPAHEEINKRILQMATSLAKLRDTSVDVLHVWELRGEHMLASRVKEEELERLNAAALQRSSLDLESLLSSAGVEIPDERVHLVKGDVREAVPAFVQRNGVGLVVMGTVGRTGLRGVLIGNTAESILSLVHCPVLTVKPSDFVSPVEP